MGSNCSSTDHTLSMYPMKGRLERSHLRRPFPALLRHDHPRGEGGVSRRSPQPAPWGLFRASSRLDVTADSNVGLLPSRRRVRRATGSATCCSGSGIVDSGRPGPQSVPVGDPVSPWFMPASGSGGNDCPGQLEAPHAPGVDSCLRSVGTPTNHRGVRAGRRKVGDAHRNGPSLLFSVARWTT